MASQDRLQSAHTIDGLDQDVVSPAGFRKLPTVEQEYIIDLCNTLSRLTKEGNDKCKHCWLHTKPKEHPSKTFHALKK